MNWGKSLNIFAHVCTCNDLGKCLTSLYIYRTEITCSLQDINIHQALHKLNYVLIKLNHFLGERCPCMWSNKTFASMTDINRMNLWSYSLSFSFSSARSLSRLDHVSGIAFATSLLAALQPVPTALLLCGCRDEVLGLGKIVGMAFGLSLANFFILNVAESWQESSRQSFPKWLLQRTAVVAHGPKPSYSSSLDLFSPFSLQRVIFGKLKQADPSCTGAHRAAISYALLPIIAWLQYKLYTCILN